MHRSDRILKNGIRKQFEKMLKELVEIPTVSADPSHHADILRGADAAAAFLSAAGAKTELVRTSGNPVLFGRFDAKGARRTVTIYNHLDVQPADEPDWKTNPFSLRKIGDKYFGRGSTDDKGPALTALLAAQRAIQTGIPLNIQFVWEFEEEVGSPHFEEFLQQKRD